MKKIILTLGEPAGIGPDLGVLLSKTSLDRNIVVIADPELIRNSALKLRQKVNINTLDNIDDKTISGKGCINVLPEISKSFTHTALKISSTKSRDFSYSHPYKIEETINFEEISGFTGQYFGVTFNFIFK